MHKDQGLDLSGHQQGDKLAKSFLAVIHAAAYVAAMAVTWNMADETDTEPSSSFLQAGKVRNLLVHSLSGSRLMI
jgi:hypothetical protein